MIDLNLCYQKFKKKSHHTSRGPPMVYKWTTYVMFPMRFYYTIVEQSFSNILNTLYSLLILIRNVLRLSDSATKSKDTKTMHNNLMIGWLGILMKTQVQSIIILWLVDSRLKSWWSPEVHALVFRSSRYR